MSTRFYDRRTSGSAPYGRRTEPDMRAELNATLDGKWPEIPKAQSFVLRKMRRDANNALTACPCVDVLTKEPDRDTFCNICHGEGWLWDEIWMDGYKVELGSDIGKAIREEVIAPGLMNVPLMVFYLRATVDITQADKIVEMVLDKEGQLVRPYSRYKLYRVVTLIDMRSDNGKLEYWKVDCYEEKRKFLNG